MCGCLSCAPYLGTWPATQACAVTGNRTHSLLLFGMMLNHVSHASQGSSELSLYGVPTIQTLNLWDWSSSFILLSSIIYLFGPLLCFLGDCLNSTFQPFYLILNFCCHVLKTFLIALFIFVFFL